MASCSSRHGTPWHSLPPPDRNQIVVLLTSFFCGVFFWGRRGPASGILSDAQRMRYLRIVEGVGVGNRSLIITQLRRHGFRLHAWGLHNGAKTRGQPEDGPASHPSEEYRPDAQGIMIVAEMDGETYQERPYQHSRSLNGFARAFATIFHPGLFSPRRLGVILAIL